MGSQRVRHDWAASLSLSLWKPVAYQMPPSMKFPGPVSFRMDWLDLLAVQGTLKSLQHHSSKASILWCSAFFMVQISHPYMTTGKTIALIKWTFVGKVMSLLFNMMSRLVISISLYVLLNFFFYFSTFNAIFKGYFPFTVITKYWLYLPYCAIHPQAWFTPHSWCLLLSHPYIALQLSSPLKNHQFALYTCESASFFLANF